MDSGGVQIGCDAGGGDASGNGALQLGAAFGGGGVVAGSAGAAAEDVAVLVADKCGGAGLAAVYAQEEFHGTWIVAARTGRKDRAPGTTVSRTSTDRSNT